MMMLMAHAYEPVVPPKNLRPELPTDLQAVVLRCLEKDLSRRFPDTLSMEHALASCSCSDQWTEDQAATWWRAHPLDKESETESHPNLPTQVAV